MSKNTKLRREMERDVMIDTIDILARERDDAISILRDALKQTGCDGDLCAYPWHERARVLIAEVESAGK